MPDLYRIKGRAPDETYLYETNPDPDRYELASSSEKPPVRDDKPADSPVDLPVDVPSKEKR